MKFQCTDLLYALGETDPGPELEAAFRQHLETCAACREEAELWSAVSAVAPRLRRQWESPELWGRIEGDLTSLNASADSGAGFGSSSANWLAIAATLFLILISGSVLWLFLASDGSQPEVANGRDPLLTERALRQVEAAEKTYVESIEELSKLVEPSVASAGTPLMINYRERLRVIDEAIRECRERLQTNQFNAHLRTQLLSVYQEKQRTLLELLKEDRREPQ